MLSKYVNSTSLLKITYKLKVGCLVVFTKFNKVGKNSPYFKGLFGKIIIPLALVGYEMIIAIEEETLARKLHDSGKRPLMFHGSVHL